MASKNGFILFCIAYKERWSMLTFDGAWRRIQGFFLACKNE